MPKYQYICDGCQTEFEVERSIHAPAKPEPCETCGLEGRQVFSAPSLKLMGDGWTPRFHHTGDKPGSEAAH